MEPSMSGALLSRDLVSADGTVVAARGCIVDLQLLREVAASAPREQAQLSLHATPLAEDVLAALEASSLEHVTGDAQQKGQLADLVTEVRFPEPIWMELEAMRRDDPLRSQHAIFTALIAGRMFKAALGEAPGVQRLVGGALVHDIGMRHAAPRLRWKRNHLSKDDLMSLEHHPMLGALILARFLGDVPAVHFALLHHTRAGAGYPKVTGVPPLRGLDVVAVASAFAAMVAPRPFRPVAFNARGAADQLLEEAQIGHFDSRAVRLLIHCLRGNRGPLTELQIARRQTGFRPPENKHGPEIQRARAG
jgi:HD-GYP domain-containing protein (c-di-GMP phosphodiesterase class II)